MRAELGVSESGLARLISAAFELLDLIVFFTAGEDKEAMARSLPRGLSAWEAAGRIHGEIQQAFVRAEVDRLEGPRRGRRLRARARPRPAADGGTHLRSRRRRCDHDQGLGSLARSEAVHRQCRRRRLARLSRAPASTCASSPTTLASRSSGSTSTCSSPGEPNAKYHSENAQEDFLVLSGECLVILDGVEHRLRAWDFVHCPPGPPTSSSAPATGPCAILMVGTRKGDDEAGHLPGQRACRQVRRLRRRGDRLPRRGLRRLVRRTTPTASSTGRPPER